MRKILLASLLLGGFFAQAKANTLIYFEDGKWFEQTISFDKNGWPKTERVRISDHQPRATPVGIFTLASSELRSESGTTLWNVTNQWDWSWELKFTEWVKAEIDPSWWRVHGLATDCADAIIAARWVFARNNALPMANRLGSGNWFTQRSVKAEWETLPTAPEWFNDQRFLAALNYLMNFTFTHTLWKDSYPVAVNTASILPGGYYLSLHGNTGHTQFVYQIGQGASDVPLTTLNSTVPREKRDLMEFLFLEAATSEDSSGFVRMRWPVWNADVVDLAPAAQMPHYSLEQYASDFVKYPHNNFWQEVFFKLDPSADYNRILLKIAKQLKDMFTARISIVEQGYKVCHAAPCAKGSADFEAWSTPSRDERIFETISIFDQISSMTMPGSDVRAILHQTVLTLNGYDYSVRDLMGSWRMQVYSSDPNDPPSVRWGL